MKGLLFALFTALLLTASGFAQMEFYKGRNGIVLLSKNKDQYFTLDIDGKNVQLADPKQSDHPYLSVDGRFLQIMCVPFEEFKGRKSDDDETVLKQQQRYEAGFHKIPPAEIQTEVRKLPSGRTTLLLSFVPKAVGKAQVFLTLRAKTYVLVLGSAVDGPMKKPAVHKFLTQLASTFHPSDRPVVLEFSPDGHYERK